MAISSARASSHATNTRRAGIARTTVASRIRAASRRHRDRLGDAAATRDRLLDLIVIMSVLMFIALVVGIGMLALGPSLHWPR